MTRHVYNVDEMEELDEQTIIETSEEYVVANKGGMEYGAWDEPSDEIAIGSLRTYDAVLGHKAERSAIIGEEIIAKPQVKKKAPGSVFGQARYETEIGQTQIGKRSDGLLVTAKTIEADEVYGEVITTEEDQPGATFHGGWNSLVTTLKDEIEDGLLDALQVYSIEEDEFADAEDLSDYAADLQEMYTGEIAEGYEIAVALADPGNVVLGYDDREDPLEAEGIVDKEFSNQEMYDKLSTFKQRALDQFQEEKYSVEAEAEAEQYLEEEVL